MLLRIKQFFAITIVAALCFSSTVSCSLFKKNNDNLSGSSVFDNSISGPGNMVQILGLTQNMYVPDTSLISDATYKYIIEHGGTAQVIIADGKPRDNIKNIPVEKPNKDEMTSSRYNAYVNERTIQLKEALTVDIAPKEAETNLIEAVITASELLKDKEGQKYIAIFHSGIITTKYGSMTDLSFDPDKAIAALNENHAIPDLNGCTVEFFGLGSVVEPQQDPTENNKVVLRDFYTKFFGETGATFKFGSSIYTNPVKPDSSYPPVRTVFTGDIINLEETKKMPEKVDTELPKDPPPVLFPDDGSFSFKPNTAEFVSPEAAKQDIMPFVEYLRQPNSMEKVVLIGTTAKVGAEDTSIDLSKQRAEAIKALLVAESIPDERILTFGAGFSDVDFYKNDINDDGSLNEVIAKTNRAVYAISSTDERAIKYIMN